MGPCVSRLSPPIYNLLRLTSFLLLLKSVVICRRLIGKIRPKLCVSCVSSVYGNSPKFGLLESNFANLLRAHVSKCSSDVHYAQSYT